MKKKSLLLFIVFLVLISTASVFIFSSMVDHNENGTCPIAVGSDCSYIDNTLAMVNHHISSIQALTQGVTTSGLSIVLMLLSVLGVLFTLRLARLIDYLDSLFINLKYVLIRHKAHPVFVNILRWMALQNKLDAYACAIASDSFKL